MKTNRQIKKMIKILELQAIRAGFLKNGSWYFDSADSRITHSAINALEWVLSDTKKEKKK